MTFEDFKIIETASSVPQRVVDNDELSSMMDTSDAWITQRTGIKRRHVAVEETTSSLATAVATKLLAKSGLKPTEIDLIVVATMSPDYLTPSVSAMVQGNLGADQAIAFDIDAACSGFVYGLKVVRQMLKADRPMHAILIGAETLSKLLDWHDRSTAVLFGDGAAGVLMTNQSSESGSFISEDLKTLGKLGKHLTAGQVGVKSPFAAPETSYSPFFKMNGHRVYGFAVKNVPESINRALEKANLTIDDIDCFVLHQANERIIEKIADTLGASMNQFPVNINEYGNTSAASEPILLAELVAKQRIKRGDVIALSGFGGGLTVGTMIIKY
ncbi:beta-ketoacyl-ACP synthase III [Lentilactobacillus buchneri]|uniref:Beta-ketoacyl-[acyl-carrier-protein] synthase III n=1 Tax=Lentilactobacillus buchneri DSM 20057 TaxID=1423728 RepID=A0A4R5NJA2_LENBU|nr:beta-ketoacyl-ACP synthase III [Lentilactobacillus buchneri]WCJ52206.1 ketoacyl-ACP synthase III [Lentilactobacillus sp. Egmn17]AEB73919.1 3-oxoacyl-(acyl-carrier-protein) synthase 3 [Lentilactobacillus buchneri NRRL B-30929]KRK67165.1 3-oxoacyl-ACP synthase [Lentilactobacillus buchneri DSM 20057]MCT3252489.1 ketoacyl-ACP synthase III [Lentilactobacillus buchneri]MCT3547078.1 ketoacyl-ACP synthase III [Lentilactobacillus buchneri]